MFYSISFAVPGGDGALRMCWATAHGRKALSRGALAAFQIERAARLIHEPDVVLSLRTQAYLAHGLVTILKQKTASLRRDALSAQLRLHGCHTCGGGGGGGARRGGKGAPNAATMQARPGDITLPEGDGNDAWLLDGMGRSAPLVPDAGAAALEPLEYLSDLSAFLATSSRGASGSAGQQRLLPSLLAPSASAPSGVDDLLDMDAALGGLPRWDEEEPEGLLAAPPGSDEALSPSAAGAGAALGGALARRDLLDHSLNSPPAAAAVIDSDFGLPPLALPSFATPPRSDYAHMPSDVPVSPAVARPDKESAQGDVGHSTAASTRRRRRLARPRRARRATALMADAETPFLPAAEFREAIASGAPLVPLPPLQAALVAAASVPPDVGDEEDAEALLIWRALPLWPSLAPDARTLLELRGHACDAPAKPAKSNDALGTPDLAAGELTPLTAHDPNFSVLPPHDTLDGVSPRGAGARSPFDIDLASGEGAFWSAGVGGWRTDSDVVMHGGGPDSLEWLDTARMREAMLPTDSRSEQRRTSAGTPPDVEMLRAALDGRSSGSLSSRGTLGAPLSRLRRRAAGQKASGMESGSSLSRDEASAEREEMPPDLSPAHALPALLEGDESEPLAAWAHDDIAASDTFDHMAMAMDDGSEPPHGSDSLAARSFQLLETQQKASQTQRGLDAISAETVAVLEALRRMGGAKRAADGAKLLHLRKRVEGLTRREAARLFYQLLVLHSHQMVELEQASAYGEISIAFDA